MAPNPTLKSQIGTDRVQEREPAKEMQQQPPNRGPGAGSQARTGQQQPQPQQTGGTDASANANATAATGAAGAGGQQQQHQRKPLYQDLGNFIRQMQATMIKDDAFDRDISENYKTISRLLDLAVEKTRKRPEPNGNTEWLEKKVRLAESRKGLCEIWKVRPKRVPRFPGEQA